MSENVIPPLPPIDQASSSPSIVDRANQLKMAAAERGQILRESVATQADEFKSVAGEKVGEFKKVASKQSAQVKDTTNVQIEATREKLEVKKKEIEAYIEENPKRAAIIALGTGLVLGLILRR